MVAPPPVFVLTGQLAASKSTLARAIVGGYERGLHVDIDGIREMVVSGFASPLESSPEVERQFDVAVEASVALALVYRRRGFAVAIEGGIHPAMLDRHLADAGVADPLVRIELHPDVEVALRRNRERPKGHDPALLDGVIREIDEELSRQPAEAGWTRLDNGHETVDATADRIRALVERG